jgi:hypothetical protein
MENKLKWQIHAETSITQIMFWILFWKIFGGWVGYLAFVMILGNIFTWFKSIIRLIKIDKDYFK